MFRKRSSIFLCTGLIVAGVACGDDDDHAGDAGPDGSAAMLDSGASMKDAGGDSGGGGGSGGSTGTGMGTGGSGGDAGDVYTCQPPAPEKGGTAAEGESCCGGLGMCTAHASGPGSSGYGLDKCAAGQQLKCAPVASGSDADAGGDNDGGSASPIASCRVDLPATLGNFDLEGRCIPNCFVTGDPTAANLGQSSCDSGSKCVPCYSPVTGHSTGACKQGGDQPVEPAPPGFAQCGDGNAGYCVASSAVANAGNVMLPQLTCATGEVCAPKVKVLDQNACFAHCDSTIGGPGACIAAYIVPEMTRGLLMQATCAAGEVCAPCISPLNMMATGACR